MGSSRLILLLGLAQGHTTVLAQPQTVTYYSTQAFDCAVAKRLFILGQRTFTLEGDMCTATLKVDSKGGYSDFAYSVFNADSGEDVGVQQFGTIQPMGSYSDGSKKYAFKLNSDRNRNVHKPGSINERMVTVFFNDTLHIKFGLNGNDDHQGGGGTHGEGDLDVGKLKSKALAVQRASSFWNISLLEDAYRGRAEVHSAAEALSQKIALTVETLNGNYDASVIKNAVNGQDYAFKLALNAINAIGDVRRTADEKENWNELAKRHRDLLKL